MIRFVRTICAAAVGVAVTGSAAGAEQNPHAPAAGSAIARYEWPKQVLELLATIYGEKRKEIDIEDPFDQKCPQVTSLVSSVGDSLGFIVPYFSLVNQPDKGSSVFFAQIGPQNSPDFSFWNESCRYTVTVRRFDIHSAGETEVGPKPVDRKRIQQQIAEDLKAGQTLGKTQSDPEPVRPLPPDAPASTRPFDSGVTRMGMTFDSPMGRIDFAGILYFAPWSVAVHFVNIPKEWTLESRRNYALKAYEIDFSNATARLRFIITKEVYADGLWVKAFSE